MACNPLSEVVEDDYIHMRERVGLNIGLALISYGY